MRSSAACAPWISRSLCSARRVCEPVIGPSVQHEASSLAASIIHLVGSRGQSGHLVGKSGAGIGMDIKGRELLCDV